MVDESTLSTLSVIERVCSIPSLLGSLFIIVTFCLSGLFHKPISRMLFYASFGNMLSNAATLMSRSYVDDSKSAGCQIQAFLIQTFMFADVFWALAMASNVYLTFYRQFDGPKLRKIEPVYVVLCYGVPFIPALIFIFLKNRDGVHAYGDANLWCWITVEWEALQLATYGLIWVLILLTSSIHIRIGCTIYKWRRRMHSFTNSADTDHLSTAARSHELASISKTTEITMHASHIAISDPIQALSFTHMPREALSVNISADPALSSAHAHHQSNTKPRHSEHQGNSQSDKAALSYARCALLFFVAMLITWIPSSANRLYVLLNGKSSLPLAYMSALVLPLQGFWNALIYFFTSRAACREFLANALLKHRHFSVPGPTSKGDIVSKGVGQGYRSTERETLKKHGRGDASESTTSLTAQV